MKDCSKIKYYGAYAAAFSLIIHYANVSCKDKNKLNRRTVLYRGL